VSQLEAPPPPPADPDPAAPAAAGGVAQPAPQPQPPPQQEGEKAAAKAEAPRGGPLAELPEEQQARRGFLCFGLGHSGLSLSVRGEEDHKRRGEGGGRGGLSAARAHTRTHTHTCTRKDKYTNMQTKSAQANTRARTTTQTAQALAWIQYMRFLRRADVTASRKARRAASARARGGALCPRAGRGARPARRAGLLSRGRLVRCLAAPGRQGDSKARPPGRAPPRRALRKPRDRPSPLPSHPLTAVHPGPQGAQVPLAGLRGGGVHGVARVAGKRGEAARSLLAGQRGRSP
jgi:hypothetical protein